jgi:hypothetical protein
MINQRGPTKHSTHAKPFVGLSRYNGLQTFAPVMIFQSNANPLPLGTDGADSQ